MTMNAPSGPRRGARHRGQRGAVPRRGSSKPWLELVPSRPPPRTHGNPFGFSNVPANRHIPLPFEHPLKEELAEVKRIRDARRLYWAEMAVLLPQDMDNPGSYDYQRQQEEERAAEKKIAELAGLIALAERGIAITIGPHQVVAETDPHADSYREREPQTGGRGIHGRSRYSRDGHRIQHSLNSNEADLGVRCRASGDTREPETMLWTDVATSQAVTKWMHEMGVACEESESRLHVPLFIGSSGRSIRASSDDEIGSTPSGENPRGEPHSLFMPLGAAHVPNRRKQLSSAEHITPGDKSTTWTLEEELSFEEAEAEREAERTGLGNQLSQLQRAGAVVLHPNVASDHIHHDNCRKLGNFETEEEKSDRLLSSVLAELDREPKRPPPVDKLKVFIQSQGSPRPAAEISGKDQAMAAEILRRLTAKRALAAISRKSQQVHIGEVRTQGMGHSKVQDAQYHGKWIHIDEADPVETVDMQELAEESDDEEASKSTRAPNHKASTNTYRGSLVEAIEATMDGPVSLTSLNNSQLLQHRGYATSQLQKINTYKTLRKEGARMSASKIRLMNREEDYKQYLEQLKAHGD
ncbi:hypothetical protein MMC13_007188 [Lambiella insularis]|nr:hypothetical protein [Lambiella insularis]